MGAGPVKSSGVGADPGERDIGRVGNIDTENAYELGDGLPEGLPGTMGQPWNSTVST